MPSDELLLIITSLIALFITFVVCISPTVKPPVKIAFAFTTGSLAFWNISIYIADSVRDHLMFWNNLVFFWPMMAVISCFMFLYLLSSADVQARAKEIRFIPRWMLISVLAVLLQLLAIGSNRIFNSIKYDAANHAYLFNRGSFYPVYIAGIILLLAQLLFQLAKYYHQSPKRSGARRALRSVVITIVATASFNVVTNLLVPVLTGSQRFIGLGTFALDIFALGLAFSIAKYHFLDIKSYALRAATYATTVVVVMLVYTGIIGTIVVGLLGIRLSATVTIVLALSALGIAISFRPLQDIINRSTKRLFFRDYYEAQDVLDTLGKVLAYSVNVKNIQDQSKMIIDHALHPAFIEFALIKTGAGLGELLRMLQQNGQDVIALDDLDHRTDLELVDELRKREVSLAVRLHAGHEDLGYLLLGYRKSGGGYSATDRRFLGLVAEQLAIGLQNALQFEEIQRFNITLQEEVDAATRKLQRQNKRLEELDDIKDDFISMASHQLRTPLTSVKGYLSMMIDGDAGTVNPVQDKMLHQAYISAQRMVFLITDLLNVSRLKTGKFVIDPQPTNLARLIEEEVEQLVDTAKAKKLTLQYSMPRDFPELMLDEVKIRQVVMNFIDNAIYYTPEGGHIDIELTDTSRVVELHVTDDGIGVPRAEQPHLFTKFYRAANARKARPDGTGLGLFMAQKVIIAQGGSVVFHSKEGQGSTFGFSFPLAKLRVPDQPTGLEPSLPPES